MEHEEIENWINKTSGYVHYIDWQKKRVDKLISIFGESFFCDKTILELGAAHGDNGSMLAALGARVTYAEGRKENVDVIKQRYPDSEVIQLNQETKWDLGKKFDIVLHWGVLYHLDNWKQDLECASRHANLIFLESEVGRSNRIDFEPKIQEIPLYDQAVNENCIGTRPSAAAVENCLSKLGCIFHRHDSPDLNSTFHTYDWVMPNPPPEDYPMGYRRFWVIIKDE
jgi:hypothetical protein